MMRDVRSDGANRSEGVASLKIEPVGSSGNVVERTSLGLLLCLHACAPLGGSVAQHDPPAAAYPAVGAPEVSADVSTPPEPEAVATADLDGPRPAPARCSGIPGAPLARVHPDLALDVEPRVDGRIEPGHPVPMVARIRNDSKNLNHAAVLPGDGSMEGWREPHLWWTAFVNPGDGCWRPLELVHELRCGVHDGNWRDEIIDLAPGDEHVLPWVSPPSVQPGVDNGRVRFYLHYTYLAQPPEPPSAQSKSSGLGAMEGVAPFELVSEPVEFELEVSLALELTARARRRRGRATNVSDVVSLRLSNRDDAAHKLVAPNPDTLAFEIEEGEERYLEAEWKDDKPVVSEYSIAAGDTVPLLGKSSPSPTFSIPWSVPDTEVVKIRALYRGRGWLRSEWVEVKLR